MPSLEEGKMTNILMVTIGFAVLLLLLLLSLLLLLLLRRTVYVHSPVNIRSHFLNLQLRVDSFIVFFSVGVIEHVDGYKRTYWRFYPPLV